MKINFGWMGRSVFGLVFGLLINNGAHATAPQAGDLIKIVPQGEFSKEDLDHAKDSLDLPQLGQSKTSVKLFKIVYLTTALDGQLTPASGMLVQPIFDAGQPVPAIPQVSYQHGTTLGKIEIPSNPSNFETLAITVLYGSMGYLVTAADYLGLGDSTGLHPYLHAKTEASASTDLLRAARNAQSSLGYVLSGKLYLAGYSQGGHATMALHRHLEQDLSHEFTVIASAPMSGPYDLSGLSMHSALTSPAASSSTYTSYVLLGLNQIYHLYDSLSDVVVAPFDTKLPVLFDGSLSLDKVAQALPKTPKELLTPAFYNRILNDKNDPFNLALSDNNLYDWKPKAPVRLYGGKADRDVPYSNAEKAYARMKDLGAQIELINVGDNLGHREAVLPSLVGSYFWIQEKEFGAVRSESWRVAKFRKLPSELNWGLVPYSAL